MHTIFIAYANQRKNLLPSLQLEERRVFQALSKRSQENHFKVHRDSFATTDSLIEYLELYASDIILFSYSGHAGKDFLLLQDQKASAKGISGLLGRCPKLKVVLLNGCSTAAQVKLLSQLPNKPLIIATEAPIGDQTAARFAISFFKGLSEAYKSVEDSFQTGLQAAQTVAGQSIEVRRDIIDLDEEEGTPKESSIWQLFAQDTNLLQWKLPTELDEQLVRQQTIKWLSWWGGYLLVGLLILLSLLFLQLPADHFPTFMVPVFLFLAPVLSSFKSQLPKKRLLLLIGIHTSLFFLFLYIWMTEGSPIPPLSFLLFITVSSVIYFLLLPMLSRSHNYKL